MPKEKKYRKLRLSLDDEFKLRTHIYSLKTDKSNIENTSTEHTSTHTLEMDSVDNAERVLNNLLSIFGKK